MRIFISKDEQQSLGLRSRWWNALTTKERELVQLYRSCRSVQAENRKLDLRHRFQFELSKHRVLAAMGDVEYQRPEQPEQPKKPRTMIMRVPGYRGTQFQFNQAGQPTEYPFFETEEWVETRFEDNDPFFRYSDDLDWLMGWNPSSIGLGGQFPREMMPGTPTSSIRVMTGYDLCKFQSKIMFDTIAPYGGLVNHLINYTCGDTGAQILASCKEDPKLAQEASDWLVQWAERINFQQKLRQSANHLLVQGIFLPRRWKDGRVTLIDPTWLRGPHNEIGQNPWSYGVFSPNWPFETETIGAYHIWYPSNEHETVSPLAMTIGRLSSTTSQPGSGKQSVPLNYRIRPLLLRLEALIVAMSDGEVKRQRITGVVSQKLADKQTMKSVINHLNRGVGVGGDDFGMPMDHIDYHDASGFYGTGENTTFSQVSQGTHPSESGRIAYNKVAVVISNSVGVASWMLGADFEDASRATSLTAAEPTVKTGKAIQAMLQEPWEYTGRSELLLNVDNPFSPEQVEKLKIHVKLPNVEVRNQEELYKRLHEEMADSILCPQDASAELGLDYEEQQEKIVAATKDGWAGISQSNSMVDTADELNKVEAPDKRI